jgi:hypothetical protein
LAFELLAVIAIDARDLPAAETWLAECRAADRAQPGVYSEAAALVLEARLAFELGNRSRISGSASFAREFGPLRRLRRPLQSLLASQAAFALTAGDVPRATSALMRLDGLHESLKACGLQDFPVTVLTRGLVAQNQRERARVLLSDYVKYHRRERAGYPVSLESVLRELNVEIGTPLDVEVRGLA